MVILFVVSHFYIAHTYYATSVHINKMAAFPVLSDFSRKVNHPFYLQTGEVAEKVEKN